MTTTAVAPTSATPPPAAASTNGGALGRVRLADNFDTFLTLLTAQLKNQDPLSPLDGTQFTEQLVSLSGVEQQLQTNDLLKSIVDNTGTGVSTAVALIGKDVKAVSDDANLANEKAQWTYNLPEPASSVKLEIFDANGRLVGAFDRNDPGDLKAGDHDFTWNGKGILGTNLPEGVYTLKVTALDAAGAQLPSTTFVRGRVTSVEQSNGQTLITVNGSKVSSDRVSSITEPATPAGSSADPTGGAG